MYGLNGDESEVLNIKTTVYITVIFFLAVILSCTGELGSSDTALQKNTENTAQGNITLFSQNYAEANNVPGNIFIARIQNTTTLDGIYSTIYGAQKSEILFDNTSKELKYTTTKNSPLIPYSILSALEAIANSGTIESVQHLLKPLDVDTFCKSASVPEIQYEAEPREIGALYICNLTPMVKCTYEISMDMKADDRQSFVELDTPGSKLLFQDIGNDTILKSFYQDDSGNVRSKTIFIGDAEEKSNFEVVFDGEHKTNTIYAENGNYMVTPFYNLERQKLPYVDFSNGYLKFTPFVLGAGKYIDVNISSISQKADRKLITPLGYSKMVAFGLDGPYPINLTGQGINYLNSKGGSGTLWFDDALGLAQYDQKGIEYLRNLVMNDSWEVGIHFSEELDSLPLDEAYKKMDDEYEYIYEKIGKKPTSWCSLRNRDNITHAIYAYNKLGMYWRNGESGVHAEEVVGNLYDDTWPWWEPASRAGMNHPVFTHQLDKDPAIKYSISYSKFKTWVDNYNSNNVSIVPFYEYSLINRNSHDAYFDNISSSGNFISFDAHTNGVKSYINVNVTAGNDTQVCDRTLNESLSYTLEKDKTINFWAENNHTYSIYLKH
jgi:hypothetical protein